MLALISASRATTASPRTPSDERRTMRSTTAVTSYTVSPRTTPYFPSSNRQRRMGKPSAPERARHHLLAAQVLIRLRLGGENFAAHRRLQAVRGVTGHVPPARPAGELRPIFGAVRHVGRLVHLLHFGRVFGDEAVRLDEIGEDVVAGPVAPDAPFDIESVLLHPPGAAHQPVEVRHLVGHVVERGPAAAGERNAVVIGAAADEFHHLGRVAVAEA